MRKRLNIYILVICICSTFFPATHQVHASNISESKLIEKLQSEVDQLQVEMAKKEDIEKLLEQEGTTLTKEELTQRVIDSQKTRIGILEGNINSILALLGAILALITLLGGILAYFLKKNIISKVDLIEERYEDMKLIKSDVQKESANLQDLSSQFAVQLREVQNLHISLNQAQLLFEQNRKEIGELKHYVSFVELLASRTEIIRAFNSRVRESQEIITELNTWLSGTLPNYKYAQIKANKIFGENVTRMDSDEGIEEKLKYTISNMQECENQFEQWSGYPLSYIDYVDVDEMEDPLQDIVNNWSSIYENVIKLHEIIAAQISQNPHQYKPRIQE